MIYDYLCKKCHKTTEVVKSMRDSGRIESCEVCQSDMERVYTPAHIVGAKVESPEFNPGLGCVVKDKYHRQELCKRKGLVEVGNESPHSMAKAADETKKANIDKIWEND